MHWSYDLFRQKTSCQNHSYSGQKHQRYTNHHLEREFWPKVSKHEVWHWYGKSPSIRRKSHDVSYLLFSMAIQEIASLQSANNTIRCDPIFAGAAKERWRRRWRGNKWNQDFLGLLLYYRNKEESPISSPFLLYDTWNTNRGERTFKVILLQGLIILDIRWVLAIVPFHQSWWWPSLVTMENPRTSARFYVTS